MEYHCQSLKGQNKGKLNPPTIHMYIHIKKNHIYSYKISNHFNTNFYFSYILNQTEIKGI